MAAEAAAGLDEVKGMNVAGTLAYVAGKFLTQAHYSKIHQKLSKDWDRLQSLTAALKLMEKYGVAIDKEEEKKLAELDEDKQIEALVGKMPAQSKDEFGQFFLQLQVLVATATKVRHALESGRPDEVETILDTADPGIAPYVLRMSIVQAGSEVDTRSKQLHAWGKDRAALMGRNIRGQEDAVSVSKKLQEAKRQLSMFQSSQNDKSKKVIMNFLNNSAAGLKTSCFKGWVAAVKAEKLEREVASEYSEKLEMTKAKLLELKTKNMDGLRASMGRQADSLKGELIKEIFSVWSKEAAEMKMEAERESMKAAMESELQGAKADQKRKAMAAMAKMTGDQDTGLKTATFSAWLTFHADYAKEKEMEEQVKAKEASIAEHIKAKGESAKKLLTSSLGSTDTGLMTQMFQAWLEVLKEAKEEAKMADILNASESKFKSFGQKGKMSGMNAMERATYLLEQMHVIRCWNAWKLDSRMEKQVRFYKDEIERRKQRLVGVQEMFRSFASELEGGLKKAGAESTRGDAPAILKHRGLTKSESAVNLPDIHKKTQVSTASHSHSYNPQARHPLEGGHQGGERPRPGKVGMDKNAAYPSH